MRAATVAALLYGATSCVALPSSAGTNSVQQYARADKNDSSDHCTEEASAWMIDNLVLKIYDWDNGGTTGTFGFRSHFSATDKTVECVVQDVDLAKLADGLTWTKCSGSDGTEFRFDLVDMSLSVKETWTCSASPGLIFHASATNPLMLHGCLDSDTDKGLESDCNVMEFEMGANVTSTDVHGHGPDH